jgi:hypothetical protein
VAGVDFRTARCARPERACDRQRFRSGRACDRPRRARVS